MLESLTPSWLDEKFLKQVLKCVEEINEEEELTVSRWHCYQAVPPGTNYLSLLYRLSVDYKLGDSNRSMSLITKTPLETGKIKEFVEKVDGYGRELKMYNEVLPKMYELTNMRVTPRSFHCPLHNSLVMEDLREQGYKMGDRLKQLDAAHCRKFLITLARFHSLSIKLQRDDPDLVEGVGSRLFYSEEAPEDDKVQEEAFTKYNLSAMLKTVESLGCEKYAGVIQDRINFFYDTMVKLFKTSGKLKVLNHGDCWTTNVLFKYNDSGEVIDAKLVDFQMCQVGSFAQDLIYFWWTSANQQVREHLQEEMFEVYRLSLNQTLEEVQITERLTKEEFDREIRRFAPYSLYVVSGLLTVAMADPEDLVDFNEMTDEEFVKPVTEESHFTKNFRSKYYRAILPDILRQLETFGAL